MAKKSDIKVCRYALCRHPTKNIDITTDAFINKGRVFYHEDCYKAMLDEKAARKKKSDDLMLFRNLWIENISNTVVFSQLFKMVNELLDRGIDLDYLIFTLQYCIEHKLNLNYPRGFPYFVDKKEIKDAYKKKKTSLNICKNKTFVSVKVDDEDKSPKFSVNKKQHGFQSILGK